MTVDQTDRWGYSLGILQCMCSAKLFFAFRPFYVSNFSRQKKCCGRLECSNEMFHLCLKFAVRLARLYITFEAFKQHSPVHFERKGRFHYASRSSCSHLFNFHETLFMYFRYSVILSQTGTKQLWRRLLKGHLGQQKPFFLYLVL
jgi:hypothetical protein